MGARNATPEVARRAAHGKDLEAMAKLVFGLQQSLDGYVDHMELGPPGPGVFRHFLEHVRDLAGCVYGRRSYEIMRYWDEDQPDWDAQDREFAAVWRGRPKWVVSSRLGSPGRSTSLGRTWRKA
jgi:hypothetical protein